jgi:hypothetical protein
LNGMKAVVAHAKLLAGAPQPCEATCFHRPDLVSTVRLSDREGEKTMKIFPLF